MLENVCTLAKSFEGCSIKISKQSIIMVFFFQMRTEKKRGIECQSSSRSGHLMIGEILIFITVNQVEKGLETGERETPHLWARSCTGTFNLNFINTKKNS